MDLRTLTAYAIVYVVWGSTYVALAIGVEEAPPYAFAGTRFLLAGAILYAWARWIRPRGRERLRWQDWYHATIVGGFMLAVGAGSLTYAETKMPAGVAALIVATVPLWLVVFDAIETRTPPRKREWAGLAAGIGGMVLLSTEDAGWKGGLDLVFVALLAGASVSWSFGSLLSRTSRVGDLRLRTAMQMLAGGALLLLMSWGMGESWVADYGAATWWSWAYLVLFGSVVAFTAYVWLLSNEPAAHVATYAFANPVVAVLLGVLMLGEPVTGRTAAAGALIVAAVIVIVLRPKAKRATEAEANADAKPRL